MGSLSLEGQAAPPFASTYFAYTRSRSVSDSAGT
jgi:hypothetical protein